MDGRRQHSVIYFDFYRRKHVVSLQRTYMIVYLNKCAAQFYLLSFWPVFAEWTESGLKLVTAVCVSQ